ncbi:hypothetical protein KJ865_13805 [Myxococcota bacterium]|nr:hypothetical protein [Myxococcota bacterium]
MKITTVIVMFVALGCTKEPAPVRTAESAPVKRVENKPPPTVKQTPVKPLKPKKAVASAEVKSVDDLAEAFSEADDMAQVAALMKEFLKPGSERAIASLPKKYEWRVVKVGESKVLGAFLVIAPEQKPAPRPKDPKQAYDHIIEPPQVFAMVSETPAQGKEKVSMVPITVSFGEDPKASVRFPENFKETQAFFVDFTPSNRQLESEKLTKGTITSRGGHELFQLSARGITRFTVIYDGGEWVSSGMEQEMEAATSWKKGAKSGTNYLITTTINKVVIKNTAPESKAKPTLRCRRLVSIIAMPAAGAWKTLNKKEIKKLRKAEPALRKVPKYVEGKGKRFCKKLKL